LILTNQTLFNQLFYLFGSCPNYGVQSRVNPKNIYGFLSKTGQSNDALLGLARLKREKDALLQKVI